MFCSYQQRRVGKRSDTRQRRLGSSKNLRIAITRKTEQTDANGDVTLIPEVTVHAVWWEQSGSAEWARYAMLTTDKR